VCERISGEFPNISVFHGELTDMELLKQENIGDADLCVAMTEDEETNILTCILSKRLGCKKASSLIMHPEYEKLIESIGIDVPLAPRKLLASKVYSRLSSKSILELLEISEDLDVIETIVPDEINGKRVSEVGKDLCGLVVAVKRGNEAEIVKGNTVLHSGDTIICVEKRG
jgi:trk system potassium uptake protein TrkA